ncbi:hypothetical protein [Caudoviricetes sp.]|nr:hypothetical protein [Caudoviricetes sp.]
MNCEGSESRCQQDFRNSIVSSTYRITVRVSC